MRTSTRVATALLTAALAFCAATSFAQDLHYGELFELSSTLNANQSHEYYANSYIDLNPGFHSEPDSSNSTKLFLESESYSIHPPEEGFTDNYGNVVGTLGGTVNIGAMGGLVYTIPLELPSGINGMEPNLSITYNSQTGNSLLGWGWNLDGLSCITRTGKTLFHNNEMTAVNLSWDDCLLLDGKRLIMVADYTDSIEYRTEQDEMSKIMAHVNYQPIGGLMGYGTVKVLDHFVIWKADGLIMEYGATVDSWIEPQNFSFHALCWLLNKVTDRNGNSIVYHYHEDRSHGIYYIDTIEYTSNESQNVQAQYVVSFEYTNRNDFEQYFVAGNQIQIKHLLNNINIISKSNSKLLYKYLLQYDYPRSFHYYRLNSIGMESYDSIGQIEKTKSTIITRDPSDPTAFLQEEITNNEIFDNKYPFLGDFNGDGYTDLALVPYKDSSVYNNSVTIQIYLNNRNCGFEHSPSMDFQNVQPSLDWIHVLDINGDGLDDLALYFYDTIPSSGTESTTIQVYKNNPNSQSFNFTGSKTISNKGDVIIGDFNGNGNTDIILLEKTYDNVPYSKDGRLSKLMPFIENAFYVGYQNDQFQTTQLNTGSLKHLGPVYNAVSADYNGDGINEVLLLSINESGSNYHGSKVGHFDFNDSLDCFKITQNLNGYYHPYQETNEQLYRCHVFSGDFNGDGKEDIIYYNLDRWRICFSEGESFGTAHEIWGSCLPILDQYYILYYPSLRVLQNTGTNQYVVSITVKDFDNDGCSDIGFTLMSESKIFIDSRISNVTPGNNASVSFRKRISTNNNCKLLSQFIQVGNFLGRDNISFLGKQGQNPVKCFSLNSVPKYCSVTCITDGLGCKTSFTYDYLTPKATGTPNPLYTYNYTAPNTYGVGPVPLPVRALKTCSVEGVNNSKVITTYSYHNAMFHKYGHGFLGFSSSTVKTYHNSTDSLWITKKDCYNESSTMGSYAMLLPQRETTFINDNGYSIAVNKTRYSFTNVKLASGLTNLVVCPAMTKKIEEIYSMDEDDELIATDTTSYQYNYNSNQTYNGSYGCTSTTQVVTGYESSGHVCELQTSKQTELQTIETSWIVNRPVTETRTRTRNNETVAAQTSFVYCSDDSYQQRAVTIIPNNGSQPNDPLTLTTQYEHDAFGHVIGTTVSAPFGTHGEQARSIGYEYGSQHQYRLLTSERKGPVNSGYVTNYEYDFHDRLHSMTDCNGKRTEYSSSILGTDQSVFPPDGTEQRSLTLWAGQSPYKPDDAAYYTWRKKTGDVTAMAFYHKSGVELRTVTFDYQGHPVYVDKRYDAKGLLESESAPYKRNESAENIQWTHYHYDSHDRVDRVDYPDGSAKTIAYNGLLTTTTVIPSQNSPATTSQTTTRKTNALGWLSESVDADGTSVFYEYYANGNLKWTRIGNDETTKINMEYDHAGNRTRLHDPDYCTGQNDLVSVYNAFGEEVSRTTPKDFTENYVYDQFGRMVQREEEKEIEPGLGVIETTTWYYCETVPQKGLLLSVANSDQTVTYSYDTCQRMEQESFLFTGGESHSIQYAYDRASRIAEVTYPSGFTVCHRYNSLGYPSVQYDGMKNELYRTNNTTPHGQAERFTLGGLLENSLEYDQENQRLTRIKTQKNGIVIHDFSFVYDGFCNLASRKDNMRNLEETFGYDDQNRLTGVWLGTTQTGVSTYDGYGRMTAKTADGLPVFSNAVFSTTAKPHAMDAATTASGVFPVETQSISYTGFDKVSKVKQGNDSILFTYGYDRQRILMEEHVGGTVRTKRYVGNCEFITETTGNVTTQRCLTYLSGPTGVYAVVVSENGNDEVYYILKDNLGSWTTIVNGKGTVEQRLSFDAWGNLRNPNSWSGSFTDSPMFDRGFTGHEHAYAFGLVNMNGRMYDPVTSSFLSVDQYVQSPDNAQGFNRYAYCMNNPLRYVDPSGWRPIEGIGGYTPNSSANAFDPYMFYGGRIPLEPRDLGLRELSTANPIITWMEENSLHSSGNGGVKPAGDAEVEVIKNTLPKDARAFVQLDKNGFIDKELLNLYQGKSLNFDNLKTLVNSDLIVEIILNDHFTFMDSNGLIGIAKMSYYPFDPSFPEDIDVTGSTLNGLSTGENGHLGQTLFPDLDGMQNSPNENIIVVINKYLSDAGSAETYSHEANGHALLYILNGGDHFGASHQPINGGFIEGNNTLRIMIINSKMETIINMMKP